jgi:hypothetical protein
MKTSKMISSFKRPLVILFSVLSFLAACKKDKDSNEAPATPVTYYTIKGTEVGNNDSYQLVSLDPATLAESVVYNLKDTEMNYIVYSPATKEILGLDYYGGELIKINPTTKQKTTIELSTELNIRYSQLVFDNANNLYALKYEGTMNAVSWTLVKIDVATGKVTALKPWKYVNYVSYLPATNELLGLTTYNKMAKYNLTSQDTSTVQLSTNTQNSYSNLYTDNKANIYALRSNSNTSVSEIVKFDAATIAESIVITLSDYRGLLDSKITYIPQRNEFVSIWKDLSFYRYDLEQKTTSVSALSTDPTVWYEEVITN